MTNQPPDPKRPDFFGDLGRAIREFRREYYATDEISRRFDAPLAHPSLCHPPRE
jgi:hypothetical protein